MKRQRASGVTIACTLTYNIPIDKNILIKQIVLQQYRFESMWIEILSEDSNILHCISAVINAIELIYHTRTTLP